MLVLCCSAYLCSVQTHKLLVTGNFLETVSVLFLRALCFHIWRVCEHIFSICPSIVLSIGPSSELTLQVIATHPRHIIFEFEFKESCSLFFSGACMNSVQLNDVYICKVGHVVYFSFKFMLHCSHPICSHWRCVHVCFVDACVRTSACDCMFCMTHIFIPLSNLIPSIIPVVPDPDEECICCLSDLLQILHRCAWWVWTSIN